MRGRSERSRPVWSRTATGVGTTPVAIGLPVDAREIVLVTSVRAYARLGDGATPPGVAAVNGVTRIASHGSPTGGTFRLAVWPGTALEQVTGPLTHDETAADVKSALIAAGFPFVTADITAGGGALPTPITLTWTGAWAGVVPPIVPVQVALTGGTNPTVRTSTVVQAAGNGGYGYIEANTPTRFVRSLDGGGALDRFLYLAAVATTVDYFLTCYD